MSSNRSKVQSSLKNYAQYNMQLQTATFNASSVKFGVLVSLTIDHAVFS